jgi:tetratricopeptide (TPR) repeat protein
MRPCLRSALLVAATLVVSRPFAHAVAMTGSPVKDAELRSLAGPSEPVLRAKARARATVLVFFRTGQERSASALKELARCEKELAGKPVRWVALVSAVEAPAAVKAEVAAAGIAMPVLFDEQDAFYQQLEIRQHPAVVFLDAAWRVVAAEAFRQVDFCDVVKTRVRFLLGEASQAELDAALNPPTSALPGQDPMKKAMRDVNMARKLLDMAVYDGAIQACQKALAVAPVAEAYAVMGDAYRKQGDCPAARKAYASALQLKADEPQALGGQKACGGK